jgi:putative sterol carrier protein
MVDAKLVAEVKKLIEAGADAATPENLITMYKLYQAIAKENDDLKEELEDMDITVQQVITDKNVKFWMKAKEGTLEYGKGDVADPSFTFSCTMAVGAGMLYGEVDATSAYMAGDITVEGNLQDAMAFQEIIELAMEAFEDL